MAGLRLQGLKTRVLSAVDLEIGAGQLVLVSGPSGSGKSLLLRAIADLDPHEGEVWLDGEARSGMAPSLWRRRVGLLPAESFWWSDSVGEHFPAHTGSEDEPGVEDRTTPFLAALCFEPDVLGWSVSRLSTGERQRLALARMLAQRPEALLLDEATANLDPSNRARVEALVEGYRRDRGAATLWVSHDPEQRERLCIHGPLGPRARRLAIRDGRLGAES